nr:EOG090X0COM [Lepidurus arcticus]
MLTSLVTRQISVACRNASPVLISDLRSTVGVTTPAAPIVQLQEVFKRFYSVDNSGYVPIPTLKNFRRVVHYPEDGKYTIEPLKVTKVGGRDSVTGRVVVGTIGGGMKYDYLWVDMFRHALKEGPPVVEKVLKIVSNSFVRSAHIALVASGDNLRYIIATTSMKPGDLVTTSGHIPRIAVRPKEGDAHPLGALPAGTKICCVERYVKEGAFFAKAAGTSATVMRKVGDRVIVQITNKRELSLSQECMAVVGQVSNPLHNTIHIGSPQNLRHMGFRPRSGLWHRKDGRYGRKIKPLPPIRVYEQRAGPPCETLKLTTPQ